MSDHLQCTAVLIETFRTRIGFYYILGRQVPIRPQSVEYGRRYHRDHKWTMDDDDILHSMKMSPSLRYRIRFPVGST